MAKAGKLQTRIEYLAARTALNGLGALPRDVAINIGRTIGHATYRAHQGLRRTGERNLQLAFPEKSKPERDELLKGTFDNIGRLLGEFSRFPHHTKQSLERIVEYDKVSHSYLHEAQQTGRGIIFLTLHLGAWEILSFAHSALYHPLAFMVRRIDNPLVEDMVEARRTRFGNIPLDKGSALRRAFKVLRDGGTLGILADVNVHPPAGIFVPFFGIPACTTVGVATLALRTNAVVLPVCAPFDKAKNKYVFQALPAIEFKPSGDDDADMFNLTWQANQKLETFIRRFPDQWLWIHKRWRTRPEGEPDLYKLPDDEVLSFSRRFNAASPAR